MSFGADISANRFKQTYFKGYVDISGEGLRLRNNAPVKFFDDTNSTSAKFSINPDAMQITDNLGSKYDVSNSQLLLIRDLSMNAQQQFNDLFSRTAHIKSGVADIDTMLLFDSASKTMQVSANIIPTVANKLDLGSSTHPFHSLYVNQGTVHFIRETGEELLASLSYNQDTGTLDLSAGGLTTPLNTTRVINGALSTPLMSYNGNVGIGTSTPRSALDISGAVTVNGAAIFNGSLTIASGDVSMNGRLITSGVYENGLPLNQKYASIDSPALNGNVKMSSVNISENLKVAGDVSYNGRMFGHGDASFNYNLFVAGNMVTVTQPTSDNSNLVATTAFVKNQNYAPLANASFTGTTSMVSSNITQKMNVGGDVSLNSKLFVYGATTMQNTLSVAGITTLNNKLLALSDVSVNGNITTTTQTTADNSTRVATTAFVQNQGYAKLAGAAFSGDVSTSGNLTVTGASQFNGQVVITGDASMGGNMFAQTQTTADNSTRVATTAFVKNQGYATLASPSFTGNVAVPIAAVSELLVFGNATFYNNNVNALTQSTADNSTRVATTAFVKNQAYATLASPTFSGTVSIPTAAVSTNLLVSGDSSFNANVFVSGAAKFTGDTTAPTVSVGDNSTLVATTAFVKNQGYSQLAGAAFTGAVSTSENLTVSGNTALNSNLTVNGAATFNGTARATTQATDDNSTKLATTEFVKNQAYATLSSPAFVGFPTAPTPSIGTANTQLATTEYVRNEVTSFINSIPSAFDAIQQLSNALSSTDASFATSLASALGLKADITNPTFKGVASIPIAQISENLSAYGDVSFNNNLFVNGDISANGQIHTYTPVNADNSTRVATTAFVKNQGFAYLTGADFTGDISTTTNASVGNSMSVANALLVGGDASLNSDLRVDGNVGIRNNLTVSRNIAVVADASFNANVNIGGVATVVTPLTSDNSTRIATTAFVNNQAYAKLAGANFTGDVTTTASVSTGGNLSATGNLTVDGSTLLKNKVVMLGDASVNQNMLVGGAIYENGVSLTAKYATLDSPVFTGTVGGITAAMVGLGNVNNTTDAAKPVSTAQQAALDLKLNVLNPAISGNAAISGNVSAVTASVQTLLVSQKAAITQDASFGGNVTVSKDLHMGGNLYAKTADSADASTLVATTEFVKNQGYAALSGAIFSGAVVFQQPVVANADASLNADLAVARNISLGGNLLVGGVAQFTNDVSMNARLSVAADATLNKNLVLRGDASLNGNVSVNGALTAVTQANSDNSTRVATTAFVNNQGYAKLAGANFTGDVSFAQSLNVAGKTTLQNAVEIVGDVSLNGRFASSGDVSLNAGVYVAGGAVFANGASVSKDLSVGANLNVSNRLVVSSTLVALADTSLNGNLSIGGVVNTVTPSLADNSAKVATTAFVKQQNYATVDSPTFTGTVSMPSVIVTQNMAVNSDTYLYDNLYVTNNASVGGNLAVTGSVSALTPSSSDNSTRLATTAFVKNQGYATLASPSFLGNVSVGNNLVVGGNLAITGTTTAVTPSTNDNSNLVATTAFVKSQPFAPLASPTLTGTTTMSSAVVSADASFGGNLFVAKTVFENGVALASTYATLASPTFTGVVRGVDASMVGLGRVDNTADMAKPVSTAQQAALDLKAGLNSPVFTGTTTMATLDISNELVVLGNAAIIGGVYTTTPASNDNSNRVATTAFVNSQNYANLSDASFTGSVSVANDLSVFGNVLLNSTSTAVTQVSSDNSTKIATTAFVKSQGFAYLSSPAFVGFPTAPTADLSASTTNQIATTKYVEGKISSFFNAASTETLNAINAVSNALSNVNSDITAAFTSELNKKADLASPTFTGTVSVNNLSVAQGFSVVGDGSFNGELRAGKSVYENGAPLAQTYATLASPTFTGTVYGITKSMIGLSNVDNTADAAKPVSTAQQAALDIKANLASPVFTGVTKTSTLLASADASFGGNLFVAKSVYENGVTLASTYATLASPTFTGVVRGIDASMVGLGRVDNTADEAKPVSAAQQAALDLKANLASPVFTGITVIADISMNGNATAVTPATTDNSSRVATTAYVKNQNQLYAQLTGAVFTGDISLNARLSASADSSFNQSVSVGKDLVVAGNITGNYRGNSIPLAAIIGGLGTNVDLSTNQTIYGVKTFMADVSANAQLTVAGNATLASNNIVSMLYQTAVDASFNTISNLSKLTNNYNGTFITNFEIAKDNGFTMAYSTNNGVPVVSMDGGNNWRSMSLISPNTSYNAMLCISPDGRVRLQQELSGTTPTVYVSTDWGVTYSPVSLSHSFLYSNAYYGYNTYNDQAYAFSHDGTVLYFIARDTNNTVVIWKNTDTTFTSFTRQNLSWNYALNNAPRAIATSKDGTYVLTITGIVPANGTYLSVSSNGGASFTRTAGSSNTTWNSIAVSYSGKYQTATNNNSIYQSSDFGVTWALSSAPTGVNWASIQMSNEGKNRVATITKGFQYLSVDYGATWQKIPNSYGNWKKSVMVDASNNNSITVLSHDGVNIFKNTYRNVDTPQTTTMNSNLNIVAPYFFMNNMGKMTKVVKSDSFTNDVGRKAAISSTGQYIVLPLSNKQTLLSQDFGETWAPLAGLTSQTNYTSAAVSGAGQYMFVRNGASSYTSSNYGASWSAFSALSLNDLGNGTAISSSGQYMVYAGRDVSNTSCVYVSTNSGAAWALKSTFSVSNNVFSAAISDAGQYMAVLSTAENLLVSSDYGATWTAKAVTAGVSVSVSSTGQYQTVVSANGIYVSKDYGSSFTCSVYDLSANYTSITMDGTGQYHYAVNSNNAAGLFISTDFGGSWSVGVSNTAQAPSNSVLSRNGKVMLYSASADICVSRVGDNVGSISETALSISKEGIRSALDITVQGAIQTQTLVVNSIYENGNLLGSKYAPLSNPVFTGTVSGVTKTMVGLGNVDNTADLAKPISTATQSALVLKANVNSPAFTGLVSAPAISVSQTLYVASDVSMGANLFVAGDLSLGGKLYATYAANTIPPEAIIGGLPGATGVFNYDISANTRLFVGQDTSLNQNLFVGKDAAVQGRLSAVGDSSLNGNLAVGKNASINSNLLVGSALTVLKDASMNRNVSVGGNVNVDGSVYCASSIYENGQSLSTVYAPLSYPSFSGTSSFDKVTVSDLTVTDKTTINGTLSVQQETVLSADLRVGGAIYENGNSLIQKYATLASPTFTGTVSGVTKAMVGLGNADNTSDANKPVSTAQQAALNLKSDVNSPIFTGVPQAPTATTGTNTSQIATTSFVRGEISNLIGSAPETLNTLQELATAINTDASFASTVAGSIGLKAPIASPTFTGTVSLPTTAISQKLTVSQDASLNAGVTVGGKLGVAGDAEFHSKLQVSGNLIVDGFIDGQFATRSIPSTAIDNIANQYGKFMFQTQRNDIVTYDEDHFATYESAGILPVVETLYSYNSDMSLNGGIYIHGEAASVIDADLSLNQGLRVAGDIYEGGVALSAKYASLSDAVFTNAVTLPNLTVTNDISLNGNLYAATSIFEGGAALAATYAKLAAPVLTGTVEFMGDASMNANLYVAESIFEGGSSLAETYAKLASPVLTGTVTFVGDASMNADLHVAGNVYEGGASLAETYAKLASPVLTGTVTFVGDASMNADLHVAGNVYESGVSLAATYGKIESPTFTGSVTLPAVVATGDATMNTKLTVAGETKLKDQLDVSGAIIAHDNLNIYGIINQYTLSLEDGNKVSFDTDSRIATLENHIATLQNQLASVLQILAAHNLQ